MPMKCQICRKIFGIVNKKHKLKDGRIVCIDCLERMHEINHHAHEMTNNNICEFCNKKHHRISKGWS